MSSILLISISLVYVVLNSAVYANLKERNIQRELVIINRTNSASHPGNDLILIVEGDIESIYPDFSKLCVNSKLVIKSKFVSPGTETKFHIKILTRTRTTIKEIGNFTHTIKSSQHKTNNRDLTILKTRKISSGIQLYRLYHRTISIKEENIGIL